MSFAELAGDVAKLQGVALLRRFPMDGASSGELAARSRTMAAS
jgi:hypothetical protein